MANLINWFEIPVTDMTRAAIFYGTLLNGAVTIQDLNGVLMGFLPIEGEGVGGGLVQNSNYVPSKTTGIVLYLNGGEDLNVMLAKVKPLGGTILQAKTHISPKIGYMALFLDTEGNRIALHSPK